MKIKETKKLKRSVDFNMLESRFGESESNRHHPAVNHNYTFYETFMKHDELMQFSLFHLSLQTDEKSSC